MKIYQLTNITPYQMMGYVKKTDGGKLIVIDGGHYKQSDELYRILKIVGLEVDLWILTHLHTDHYGSIIDLLKGHSDVKIKQFWRNIAEESMSFLSKAEVEEFTAWCEFEKTLEITFHKPTLGEKISFDNVSIEILGVANPEIHNNIINNQSMVLKITDNNFSMIFLGDLGIEGGEQLLRNHNDLHADAVQMAHHGQQGVNKNVYEAIGAEYAFWPTPKWLWNNTEYLGGTPGKGNFQTPEVIRWMSKLSTKNITSFEKTVVFDTVDKSVKNV